MDGDEFVFAHEGYIAIHTAEDGKRTIHFKDATDVEEVFEKRQIGKAITEFTEDVPKHTTRLYKLKKEAITDTRNRRK